MTLSNCCGAEMTTQCTNEGTSYWICNRCLHPCDRKTKKSVTIGCSDVDAPHTRFVCAEKRKEAKDMGKHPECCYCEKHQCLPLEPVTTGFVDSIMPRSSGKCNGCIMPGILPGSEHCKGLELGCGCECRNLSSYETVTTGCSDSRKAVQSTYTNESEYATADYFAQKARFKEKVIKMLEETKYTKETMSVFEVAYNLALENIIKKIKDL